MLIIIYVIIVFFLTLVELVGSILLFLLRLDFCLEYILNVFSFVVFRNECCLGEKKIVIEYK